MALLNFDDFFQSLPPRGRLMGCDVGEKTIGLALSDVGRMIASPLYTLRRERWKQDSVVLLDDMVQHDIVGVIIGFPLNMNGSEGPRCQSIRQFASNLVVLTDRPLCLWDERLSTVAATRPLLDADLSRRKREKIIDKLAACYILQGFLDALRFRNPQG